MLFNIEATPEFLSEAKKLAKKYPSLKNDIAGLAKLLTTNPTTGISLGKMLIKFV